MVPVLALVLAPALVPVLAPTLVAAMVELGWGEGVLPIINIYGVVSVFAKA